MTTATPAPAKVPNKGVRKRARRAQYLRFLVKTGTASPDHVAELARYEAAGGHRAQTLPPEVVAAALPPREPLGPAFDDENAPEYTNCSPPLHIGRWKAGRPGFEYCGVCRAERPTSVQPVAPAQTPPHFDFVEENRTQVAPNANPAGGVPHMRDQVELPVVGGQGPQVQTTQMDVPPPGSAPPPVIDAKEVESVVPPPDPVAAAELAAQADIPPGLISSMYVIGAGKLHDKVNELGGLSVLPPKDAMPFAVVFERTVRQHIGNGGKVDFAAAVAVVLVQAAQVGVLTWLQRKRGVTLAGAPVAAAAPAASKAQQQQAPDLFVVSAASGKDTFV